MPVRSLNSSVLAWPNRARIDRAVRSWADRARADHPELRKIGYFGSYARGDWGVGSDLDLVAVVEQSDKPRSRRAIDWDLDDLPVPAELLIYTTDEWRVLAASDSRFGKTLLSETVWIRL